MWSGTIMESSKSSLVLVRAVIILLCAERIFADVGLRFVRAPEPIAAPPGDDVAFECSLNVPAEQVRWRHNGRYLNQSASNSRSLQNSNHLNVQVKDMRQTGDYQCVAWYGASALASVPAHLSLAEMGDFPSAPDTVLQVRKGNTILVHCQSPNSNPPAVLQYFKDGKNLPESVQVISSTGTLVLPNVSEKDEGVYTCSASNYITGNTINSHQKITLQVLRATEPQQPRFPYRPVDSYSVAVGSNITIECAGTGYPTPTVSWRRMNGALPIQAEQIPGGLRIVNINATDRGTYICELSNGVNRIVPHEVTLFVQEPPTLLSEPPKQSMVEEGGYCQLECRFRGEPSPVISWLLNGESVINDSLIKSNGGILQVTQLEKRHAGIYQCMATNAQGTTYGSTLLQVRPKQVTAQLGNDNMPEVDDSDLEGTGNIGLTTIASSGHHQTGKKGHRQGDKGRRKDKKHKGNAVMIPPTKPQITRLSDESVMVRWSVPQNDGLPIQFFKVQYKELGNGHNRGASRRGQGNRNRWMTSNEDIAPHIRSYEVANLEPDHTYRFRIAAVYSNNDNKLGPNSAKFHLHRGSPTLKTHPNAPLLTRTEAVSPSAIQIHWQFTPSASTPIEGFYVYYRATSSAGDYVKATVEGEQTRDYIITHLSSDTSYDIKLQSFTVGAASDFSTIHTHKTQRETTTPPPQVIQSGPSVITDTGSSQSQLYMVLGAVLGGLGLLLALFLLVFLCNRHNQQSQEGPHNTSHVPHETIERDKPLETVVNGFSLNGRTTGTLGPLGTLGTNHSSMGNGHLQPNGLLMHANTITITGNPLDDKKHTTMEMTFLSSHTNNNCSIAQRTAAAGSGALLKVHSSLRSASAVSEEENDLERMDHTPCRASENYV